MAESVHNPEVYEALREAGAGEQSSRAAARATPRAEDMVKSLIWIKVLAWAVGGVFLLNVAILGRLFELSDRISDNTSEIRVLATRVQKLEEGQAEIRKDTAEIKFLLQSRRSGQAAPVNPSAPSVAPEVSVAPGGDSESPGLAVPPVPEKTRE